MHSFSVFSASTVLIMFPNSLASTHSCMQRFIEARGGKHLRFKKGYKNVIDKAIELNDQVRTSYLQAVSWVG